MDMGAVREALELWEEFAFKGERDQVLTRLVPHTRDWFVFRAMDGINKGEDISAMLEEYREKRWNWLGRQDLEALETKNLLLKYDRAESGADREKVLEELRNKLRIRAEPQNAARSGSRSRGQGGSAGKPSVVDAHEYSLDAVVDRVASESIPWSSLTELGCKALSRKPARCTPALATWLLHDGRYDPRFFLDLVKRCTGTDAFEKQSSIRSLDRVSTNMLREALPLLPRRVQRQVVDQILSSMKPGDGQVRNETEEAELVLSSSRKQLLVLDEMRSSIEAETHDSLRMSVLENAMEALSTLDRFDQELLMAHLQLSVVGEIQHGSSSKAAVRTRCPPEVLAALERGFRDPACVSIQPFDQLFSEASLKELFVETKMLHGQQQLVAPGSRDWGAFQPSPTRLQELVKQVQLEFDPTSPTVFARSEPVHLKMRVKAVSQLLVKVFEINLGNCFRQRLEDVDPNVDLNGVVPTVSHTVAVPSAGNDLTISEVVLDNLVPPDKTGCFVVDVFGKDKWTRAIIRKGRLWTTQTVTPVGVLAKMFDETNTQLTGQAVAIWLRGKKYSCEENGSILLPFATAGKMVLQNGDFCALADNPQEEEHYKLSGSICIPREDVRTGVQDDIHVVVHASLLLANRPVSVSLLQKPKIVVTFFDELNGTTSQTFPVNPVDDQDMVVTVNVKRSFVRVSVVLSASVVKQTSPSLAETDVGISRDFHFNQMVVGRSRGGLMDVCSPFLEQTSQGAFVRLLGRNGDPVSGEDLHVSIHHDLFRSDNERQNMSWDLCTDNAGRVQLGSLLHVATVTVTRKGSRSVTFPVIRDEDSVHGLNEEIVVSDPGSFSLPLAPWVADLAPPLLIGIGDRHEGHREVRDCSSDLVLTPGSVGLAASISPGQYWLSWGASGQRTQLRVVGSTPAPTTFAKVLQSASQTLPIPPVHASISSDGSMIEIDLINPTAWDEDSRIHLVGSHFAFPVDFGTNFEGFGACDDTVQPQASDFRAQFTASTSIDDELQYILNRPQEARLGNMLPKPSLLLKPLETKDTDPGIARDGIMQKQRPGRMKSKRGASGSRNRMHASPPSPSYGASMCSSNIAVSERCEVRHDPQRPDAGDEFCCLGFLSRGSACVWNVKMQDDNKARVPLAPFVTSGANIVQVVVLQGISAKFVRAVVVPRDKATSQPPLQDCRLQNAFPANAHLIEAEHVHVKQTGESLHVSQPATASFDEYASLEKIFDIMHQVNALAPDQKQHVHDLLAWHELSFEEKRVQFERLCCHETNLFLKKKDPNFFEAVVRPALSSKLQKTFMDYYLLDDTNLDRFLQPNACESLTHGEVFLLADAVGCDVKKWAEDEMERNPNAGNAFMERFWRILPKIDRSGGPDDVDRDGDDEMSDFEMVNAADEDFGGAGGGGALEIETALPPPAPPGAMAVGMQVVASPVGTMSRSSARSARRFEVQLATSMTPLNGKLRAQRFEPTETTKAFVETCWKDVKPGQHVSLDICQFWMDFLKRDRSKPFLTGSFPLMCRGFRQVMVCLSLLDLPLLEASTTGSELTFAPDGRLDVVVRDSYSLLALKSMEACSGEVDVSKQVVVYQHILDPAEKTRRDEVLKETVDNFVEGPLVTNKPYMCDLVCCNMTSFPQRIKLLCQIPSGAIPLQTFESTNTTQLEIGPFQTYRHSFYFFFPTAGEFEHFPSHAMKKDALIGFGEPRTLTVLDTRPPVPAELRPWSELCDPNHGGSKAEILEFLRERSIVHANLRLLQPFLADRAFFTDCLSVLRKRFKFSREIWAFAFVHDDQQAMREYLVSRGASFCQTGRFKCTLFDSANPLAKAAPHTEFDPLVNSRAHSTEMPNQTFAEAYMGFLVHCANSPQIGIGEMAQLLYFLVVQGRVTDAMQAFEKFAPQVEGNGISASGLGPQLDFIKAYVNFSDTEADLKVAREMLSLRKEEIIPRWRSFFDKLGAQLEEVDKATARKRRKRDDTGKAAVAMELDEGKRDETRPARDPALRLKVEQGHICIQYAFLKDASCRVSLYEMDVEPLFSSDPFLMCSSGSGQDQSDRFTLVKPNLSWAVELPSGLPEREHRVPLPEKVQTNVRVQVASSGIEKSCTALSSQVALHFIRAKGHLEVVNPTEGEETPLPGSYVKVYAKLRTPKDKVVFWKDGYTDRRGMFDFVTVTSQWKLEAVESFAVLAKTEHNGSVIEMALPPTL